jgi:hypothetical protein
MYLQACREAEETGRAAGEYDIFEERVPQVDLATCAGVTISAEAARTSAGSRREGADG